MTRPTFRIGPRTSHDVQAIADIGMGNFLWKALGTHGPNLCSFVSARPFETAWGECCDRLTLGDLARIATVYARHYAGLGIGRQDLVGIYVAEGGRNLIHFLALTRVGAVPVLVNDRLAPDTASRYLRRVGVRGVYTDEPRRTALGASPDLGFVIIEGDFLSVSPADICPYEHDRHDPVAITHTSGTTGLPKAVMLQHYGYFFPIERELSGPVEPAMQRVLSALPPSHNSAISAAALTVVAGRELMQMTALDGPSVLKAIETYRPTSVVAFPQTFVDILESDPESYDLSSISMWLNLGDAAHEKHIRPLLRFGSHRKGRLPDAGSQFIDGLGSSEMGFTLFSNVHSPNSKRFGRCIGLPRPWVDAVILAPDGTEKQDGEPGLIAVRSPSVSAGYWNDSNLTFKSRLNGYFLTGDMGTRDRMGRFYHLDRTTDTVMTKHGPVHTLLYEELVMSAVDEMLDCCVIAVETQPGEAYRLALAMLRRGAEAIADPVRKRANKALVAHGLQPLDELRIIPRTELAVGVTGKVLKARLREELRHELAGRRAVVGSQEREGGAATRRHHRVETRTTVTEQTQTEIIRGSWQGGLTGGGNLEAATLSCPVSAPVAIGGSGLGESPSSLLVVAASGCYLVTLASMLEQKGVRALGIAIETEAQFRGAAPPVLSAIVHRPTVRLDDSDLTRLAVVRRCFGLAKDICTATRAMSGVTFSVEGSTAVEFPGAA